MIGFEYYNPAKIVFGEGSENNLKDLLAEYDVKSLLLVYSGDFVKKLGVEYTDVIRTTDESHEHLCQEIWKRLGDHIYHDTYEGWYCEGCEGFVTQKEYDETGGVCPDHNKPYVRLSESNYYLRISDFKEQIKKAIESDEMKILPDFRNS